MKKLLLLMLLATIIYAEGLNSKEIWYKDKKVLIESDIYNSQEKIEFFYNKKLK